MKTDIPETNSGIPTLVERFNPVDRFIVSCLGVRLDHRDEVSLGGLQEAAARFNDWEVLLRKCEYHGVTGWVHEALLLLNGDRAVPDAIIDDMRLLRMRHITQIAVASRNLASICAVLKEKNVEHLLLKGPYLAECVYPRSGLRFYTDLDLMVGEKDLPLAEAALVELGYSLIDVPDRGIFDEGKTQVHYHQEGCLPIDLHWDIINLPMHASSICIDLAEIRSRTSLAEPMGCSVSVLSPEDLLLFQCVHMAAHHDFNRLIWFKDVEQVIARFGDTIDWDKLISRAESYGLKTYTYYSFAMTGAMWDNQRVPMWVMEKLRPRYLSARLFEHFLGRANLLELQATRRKPALEIWRVMRDGRQNRMKAIRKRTFPKVEWYLQCYPFLPKTRHRWIYYSFYPGLMVLRALRPPFE